MSAALRKRLRDDDGLSLAELLVAMMVTSVLLAIIGSMFVSVALTTTDASATTRRGSIGTNLMNATSEAIRMAVNNATSATTTDPAVISGTTSSLSLYSYIDAVSPAGIAGELVPTKISFTVDGKGNLVETRVLGKKVSGYWVFTDAATSRAVGGPVLTSAGDAALFVYFDAAGKQVALTSTSSAAVRATVTSVRVTIQIANQLSDGSDPIVISSTVGMINLRPTNTGKK